MLTRAQRYPPYRHRDRLPHPGQVVRLCLCLCTFLQLPHPHHHHVTDSPVQETCESTDVACQCDATYLENIYNCASCNTANGNSGTVM
jgi:hypothetical protein